MVEGTIFLTGGSGYVGRNIIRRLVAEGRKVRALARSGASAEVITALGAEAWRGDIMDLTSLEVALAGCMSVIHAAGDVGHGVVEAEQHRTNVEGTRNVFAAARQAGLRRAVHISTESVLLSGAPLIEASETTQYPKKFAGPYSASKAAAEQAALALSDDAMPIVVVRPRFIWGRDDSTALPKLIAAARSGKLAWIGGGRYRISATHIDNVVEGVMLALENGRGGQAYFITDGEPREFRAFATKLLEAAGIGAPTKSIPRWLSRIVVALGSGLERLTGGRIATPLGMQEYATVGVEVTLDISKARNELGYEPIIGLDEGLATIVLAPSE